MLKKSICLILAVLLLIGLFTVGVGSCQKKSSNIKTGSSYNTFQINAPSGLTTTLISSYQINLMWQDNSNNEDGFEIWRSFNGTNWGLEPIATVTANITSYFDNSVSVYTIYYYRVRAFNDRGDRSGWSNQVSATPTSGIWRKIAAGEEHTLALTDSGVIWSWGWNENGQLGINDYISITRGFPTQVGIDTDWFFIEAGSYHSLALKIDRTLWAWGNNEFGQLGLGSTEDSYAPEQVGVDSDWFQVTGGYNHTIAFKTNGTIWAWGWNNYGQLGLGDTIDRGTPTQIGIDTDWSSVASGYYHSLGIKYDASLWAWGDNSFGQLGDGTLIIRTTPRQIGTDSDWLTVSGGYSHTVAVKTNYTLWDWGFNNNIIPTPIGTDSDWVAVAVGGDVNYIYDDTFNIARKTNGTLWAWGRNNYGQLGLGDTIDRINPTQIGDGANWSEIAIGSYHALALNSNGILYTWGNNRYGQLGAGNTINRNIPYSLGSPASAPTLFATAVSSSRIDLVWIDNIDNESGFKIERSMDGTNYELLTTSNANSTSYLDTDLTLGATYYYRVKAYNIFGDGIFSNEANATTYGIPFSLVAENISSSQINLFWTDTADDEQGFKIERRMSSYELWNQIGTVGTNITSYSDFNSFLPDTVYHYRIMAYNALGNSSYSNEVYIVVTGTWGAIAGVGNHNLAIRIGGTLWSWGRNDYGQLGLGDTINRATPTQVGTGSEWSQIAGGDSHSLALDTNGSLWGWGSNNIGQLGLGDSIDRYTPAQINTDSDWSVISAKVTYSLALKTNRTMWAWGNGPLGLGDLITRKTPTQIGTDSDWAMVEAGDKDSAALKTNNTLWLWGFNTYGELGMGDNIYRYTPAQFGTDSDWSMVKGTLGVIPIDLMDKQVGCIIAIKTNKTLWAWGANGKYGQLGLGNSVPYIITAPTQIGTDSDWFTLVAGASDLGYGSLFAGYNIALKANNSIWSWGYNKYGQLGLGDTDNRNTPTQISSVTDWSSISVGRNHSAALKSNNTLWTWGSNNYSQLGRNYGAYSIPIPVSSNNPSDIPSSFTVTAASSSQINLFWVDNSNTETGFRIERKISVTNYSLLATVGSNAASYADNAVNLEWMYYYRICAYNDIGNTPYSNEAIATPIIFTPTNLSANVISSTQVNLTWVDNSPDETGFKIERKYGDTGTYAQIDTVGSVTSYSDTNVTPGNVCYYHIRAYNAFGNSAYSNEIYVVKGMDWSIIAAGENHTIGIKTNGTIWSWGLGDSGQLGYGNSSNTTTPTQIGTISDWVFLTAGGNHSHGIKTNGTLWSWGANDYYQLGLGNTLNRNTPSIVGSQTDWVSISAGYWHAIARKTNGTLWSWGYNGEGALGVGDNTDRSTPSPIGADTNWSIISAGGNDYSGHSLAVKTDPSGGGTLWSWGYNSNGQLGLGNSGSPANDKNIPTQIGTQSDWSKISAGYLYTIACKTNGTIWSWGDNSFGQLGLGNTAVRNTPTSIGTNSDWVSVTAGGKHTIASKTNGTVWSWGYNYYGQLGLGDSWNGTDRKTPTQIGTQTDWSIIIGGGLYSLARQNNGTLWSWGKNNAGQLGIGNMIDRNVPTLILE